jgi:hypothetical protein
VDELEAPIKPLASLEIPQRGPDESKSSSVKRAPVFTGPIIEA